MSEFKQQIPAAGGKVDFVYRPEGGIATRISGPAFRGTYLVAVSMDGRYLLASVPAGGLGQTMVYPKPSVLTYIQSDEQGMWGRNCPRCEKYFRTNHVMDHACCPYCAAGAPSLAFISKAQHTYIQAFYDAWARAYLGKTNTSLDVAAITDQTPAWHYSEEKQQVHFKCDTPDCQTETDMLGDGYGYCPRCGRTNARKLFTEFMDEMLTRLETTKNTVSDEKERGTIWEEMTVKSISKFEALAKHLRRRLLCLPMTAKRRKQLEDLTFQRPLQADKSLVEWFDIGVLEWVGNDITPKRTVPTDSAFITKMLQKRHVLVHNDGIVDQDYIDRSGDTDVRLDERIRVRSHEAKRFVETVRAMGANLLDNVEYGFSEG
ncbi:MAG: hypothetical protein ACHP78_15170 [Terriglobales bacterium]